MKRIISILLVLATVAVSLAACNGKTPAGTDPSHQHAFGEWVTVKAPNCTEKGQNERVCECGEKETEEIAVNGEHVYDYTVKSPTTEEGGYTIYTCTVCNHSYTADETEKLPKRVDGMMVYFEDFEALKDGATSAELFKALGWKNLYENGRVDPVGSDPEDSKAGAAGVSTITLAAESGQLIVKNAATGRDSFIQILTKEYMTPAAEGDYTVRLDMTFKSGNGWASIAPRYWSNGYSSYYAAWKVKPTGYGNHEAYGKGADTEANYIRPTSGVDTVKYGNTTVATGWWCSRVAGYGDITVNNKSGALIDRRITVLIQIVRSDSDYNHKPTAAELGDTSKMTDAKAIQGYKDTVLGCGFHIWVLDENGQKVLVSAYNPNSNYNSEPEKWTEWLGDTLAFGAGANVTVAIDNLAVWTGLGDMPEDKSTDAYEKLLQPIFAPIVADKTETGLVIAKDNETRLYVVVPENADRNVLYAKDKLNFIIKDMVGAAPAYFGTRTDNAYELLLGDTGREESKALKATLVGNQYAIKREGNKLIVVATNDAFLYDAVEYLAENYFVEGKADVADGKLILNSDIDYVGEGDTTTVRYLFTQSFEISSTSTQAAAIKQPDNDHNANQGGCTDGKFYYQAFIDRDNASNEANNTARIVKTDLSTGKQVMVSEKFMAGHTNDITYNPTNNKLYVANNKPFNSRLAVIDADTLAFEGYVNIPGPIYSITYSPERDIYFIGCSNSNNVRGLNADFGLLDQDVHMADRSTWTHTTQGIGSDDTFVYCVLWQKNNNVIAVFDWYGNYVGTIKIRLTTTVIEPESIDVDDQGRILVVANKRIWHVTPKAKS